MLAIKYNYVRHIRFLLYNKLLLLYKKLYLKVDTKIIRKITLLMTKLVKIKI